MTLKLLQDFGVFNVNVLFTFLNLYSLDINNNSQHLHHKSSHFLAPTSSFLNSPLFRSFRNKDDEGRYVSIMAEHIKLEETTVLAILSRTASIPDI